MIRLEDGNDKAGKSGACPKVEPDAGVGRQAENLGGIGEMPVPKLGKGLGRDEICAGLPLGQELGVANKPVDCFTWNFKGFRELFRAGDGI